MYIGAQPYLLLTEPKDLEFVMNSMTILSKSDSYDFIQRWLGFGLLTGGGNRWRKHRKIITPAFHFQILEEFIDVFNSQADVLVNKLKEESKKGTIDIYPFIARCTLDIICETAMGTSVNAQANYDSEYVKCVNILLEIVMLRAFSPILSNNVVYPFTSTYRRENYALKVVHDYTKSVIASRKKEFLSDANRNVESTDSLGRKRKRAFLDLLLEYSTKDPSFTEEHIREEVDTFMFEGHDTTATSITFALQAIARHPEVQKKIYEELQTIFADDPKRKATHRDLQAMKYLEMAIKESLRIYTTVPMIGRRLEEDVQWNGMTLPKGLMINMFLYGVQNSDVSNKDPEVFDPERFNAENSKGRHPYAYVPFSAGARNCIGQKFAMLEMKSTMSSVLRNFELLPPVPDHKMILKNDAVLKSDNGVFIRNTYRREKRAVKIAHDYTNSVIAQRRKLLNNVNRENEESKNITGKKARKPLLDLLLEYSMTDSSFTEKDLQREVDTFVVGGYDSTATAVTFILYCLARNPEIQQKVYEELKAIFADDPQRKPTSADLQAMRYLEMVIKEALRLYTPIPLIGRRLENDVDWNGVKLPKGLMMLICLQCVHKSVEHWGENSDKFDPEHFNVENSKDRHPYAYVPFSTGIRNCIGQKYAMLELKCIMATTLRRIEVFKAHPDNEVILKCAIMLKPINGVYIRLKSR
ncbi:cytochrome p450 family 4 [Holotrichia oblita]|uniref:Cytochrome p450 family 4 n=1 Tax=Holotrichia oblita TaxID=644536 RepID=A0ACB9TGD2_HOLOL|nr:cytochrome p450 family 4 [Holotrichia oblita]